MDKLIIIVFGYDGDKSNNANSICLDKIIKYLSEKNEITLITSTDKDKVCIYKGYNNMEIFKIPYKTTNNGKIDFSHWKRKVVHEISSLDVSNFSKLLTISFPFPILKIGYEIKRRFSHLEWFIYELDPYAYNKILRFPRLLFFYRLIIERKIFSHSNKILLTHELFNSYKNSLLRTYSDKFIDIGIPLLEIYNFTSKTKELSGEINISYIGSLNKKVRNPEYVLRILAEIKGIKINFYGADPSQISTDQKKIFGDRLIMHERIPKSEIKSVLNDSDVLLNIGNNTNNQLPSKVLEYIGTGKPIISVYSIKDDTSNLYLKKYPNSLLINQNSDFRNNVEKLEKFLLTIDRFNTLIDPKKIETIFENETIEAVAQRIVKSLSNRNKESSR